MSRSSDAANHGQTVAALRDFGRRNSVDPLDVDILLAAALDCRREDLYTHAGMVAPAAAQVRFEEFVKRRAAGEPVAYLLGEKEFYGRSFRITPDVLVPRPETEGLVEQVLSHFSTEIDDFLFLDVGTGSGVVALSVLAELGKRFGNDFLRRGRAIASDISENALAVAQTNAATFGLEESIQFVQSDLLETLSPAWSSELNIIAANLPYIPDKEELPRDVHYEPTTALRAGADGLREIRRLVEQLTEAAPDRSLVLLEIGENQGHAIESLAQDHGLSKPALYSDLQGIQRIAELRLTSA